MRLVFAGTPAAAVPSLAALLESGHEVAAVITRPDAPAGRGLRVAPSPVAQRAAAAGLEVLRPARPRDPDFLDRLRQIAPDCCAVTAYGALIPQTALDIPAHGWVNLHFSLLPAWRGAAPVQHAIMHGDDITGATTFRLVAELDAGPVFGMVTEPIQPADTAGDLLDRLALSGAALLVATMDGIESGQLTARPQPAGRGQPGAEDHARTRASRLGTAGPGDRPPDPRLHAAAGRVDRAGRVPGSSSGRWRALPRQTPAAATRGSCGSAVPGSSSAPDPGQSSSVTCSRTASGAMPAADWARGLRGLSPAGARLA